MSGLPFFLPTSYIASVLCTCICYMYIHSSQVVGEYSYVLEDVDTEDILEKITTLLTQRFDDKTTSSWVISSVTKLVARLGSMPDAVQSQVAVYLASTDTDIQQVCRH